MKYIKFLFKSFRMPVYRFNIVYGRVGSGKSYYMAKKIRSALFSGRDVNSSIYINYDEVKKQFEKTLKFRFSKFIKKPLKLGKVYLFDNLDDFVFMENSLVVFDEGHKFFYSRDWEKLKPYIKDRIYEFRKNKIDILVGVQDVHTLDKILRRLGDNAIQIRSFFIFQFIKYFEIKDIDKEKRKSKWLGFYVRSPKIFDIYDSFEKIIDFNKVISDNYLIDKRKMLS